MSLIPVTWSGDDTVSGALAVNSDAVTAGGDGYSGSVVITGTGSGGISGNLCLFVSDGAGYSMVPGSLQSVLVNNGASQTFNWSQPLNVFDTVYLAWVPGDATNGTLGPGNWSITGTLAPVVTNVAPPVGQTIQPSTPLSFDVTDPNGLPFVILVLTVAFTNGSDEVAFAGGLFTPLYVNGSSIAPVADGYAFSLVRSSGWPSPGNVTLTTYVADEAGNVAA